MSTIALALMFFLVANPIGNSPAILALIKDASFERQKLIVLRESLISFLIAIFFQFFGELFLGGLHITNAALIITGGIVQFLTAVQMLFHKPEDGQKSHLKQEPFIVPIATPLISGPGLMTIIMVNSAAEQNNLKITSAILIAWLGVTFILFTAPYLQKLIGRRGMEALEQVMGMILALVSMSMIVKGAQLFVKTL